MGEPGSPEFVASYMAAHATRREPDPSRFHSVIVGYKASQDFLGLKPRTKADYLKHIAKIEEQFGDLPLAALDDARVTRDFLEWRDSMAHSPRQADYAWMVLMRLLSWARGRGLTLYRPPERVERLYHADRSEKIWTEQHIAAFMAVASEPLQRALVLALETGQRQGDLLMLPWVRLRWHLDKAAAGQDRPSRQHPGDPQAARRAGEHQAYRDHHPDQQTRHGLASGTPSARQWGDASRKAEHQGPDVSRPARNGGDAARRGRVLGRRDRQHHRPLHARRWRDPRHLSRAHRQDRARRDRQAGKGQGVNANCKTSCKMPVAVSAKYWRPRPELNRGIRFT